MKKYILIFSVIVSSTSIACVDLSGEYADKVTTLKFTQKNCESLVQSFDGWYIASEVNIQYVFDGKEYVDKKFKTSNGSYAYVKSQINEKEMLAIYRRGSPTVQEKVFVKKFSKDSKESLIVTTFDIQKGKEILKEKWVLRKK